MTNSELANQRLIRALKWSGGILAINVIIVLVVVWVFTSEDSPETVVETRVAPPVISNVPVELPPLQFVDWTEESGVRFMHENGAEGDRLLPETMGGGVAVFDYDLDEDLDLLFVNSKSWTASKDSKAKTSIFENQGGGTFKDVTEVLIDLQTYGMGAAVGDFNGDRYPDLFVTSVGKNHLFINRQGASFDDVTAQYGVSGSESDFSTCATFLDFDQDGDLDLFVCSYVEWSAELDRQVDFRLTGVGRAYGPPTDFPGANSYLYRNDGDHFTDVTSHAGIEVQHDLTRKPIGKALAVAVYDFNGDLAPDLFVANDTTRNFLFVNQQDGTFVEQGIEYGVSFDSAGLATGAMGIDVSRFANDERVGVAIGNFANEMSSFYVGNRTTTLFSDDAVVVGIGAPTRKALTFGLFFADLDNDGASDLFSVNGHIEPEISSVQASQDYRQQAQLFWNCQDACSRQFQLLPNESTGLVDELVGRGAAYGDLDSDGDLDLIVTQTGDRARIYLNESNLGHQSLSIQLFYKSMNQNGIGSTISLISGSSVQVKHVTRSKSYLSQVPPAQHFGLGVEPPPFIVEVLWPNQVRERYEISDLSMRVVLQYGEGVTLKQE